MQSTYHHTYEQKLSVKELKQTALNNMIDNRYHNSYLIALTEAKATQNSPMVLIPMIDHVFAYRPPELTEKEDANTCKHVLYSYT